MAQSRFDLEKVHKYFKTSIDETIDENDVHMISYLNGFTELNK